jgi:DNA polymerase III epsilon subunit-like protein
MTVLGKPTHPKKFRCKVTKKKCRICGKEMLIKTNNLHGYYHVYPKNRVTCSRECSRKNLDNIREREQKKAIEKRKLDKLKQH